MLVLAVHGSAVPAASATIDRLLASIEALSGVRAVVGHLDVQRPSLAEVVAEHPHAVVVPLLLGDGYHRRVDIPAVLAEHGAPDCVLTEGLAREQDVALALYGRLREAERRRGPHALADAVLVAGAGSSRPGGNDGTLTCVEQLSTLLECDRGPGPIPVVPAYLTSASPTPAEALAALRAAGHERIAVATHLLAPGRFTEVLDRLDAWTVSAPLADHPRLARLVLRRWERALRESARGMREARTARLAS
ncbi:sirohydrochlorin chelatase [Streptomyces sp. BI20]|uniref:sirohydrochlorin chelatase n=1 Tax=Streptomyces sp. BI20 TaxID=3403460 RepID=UPI003C779A10